MYTIIYIITTSILSFIQLVLFVYNYQYNKYYKYTIIYTISTTNVLLSIKLALHEYYYLCDEYYMNAIVRLPYILSKVIIKVNKF